MVGTWGLEPATSTVSTPEFKVNRCTYKALVATKSPVGYGSSAYCDLNVPTQMPIVPILHSQSALAAAGRNDCHLRGSSPSVVTPKPANGGQGKTGQREEAGDSVVLSCRLLWRQVYFRAPTPRTTFEYMTVMEKTIEHGGDGGAISQ